jgi:hypothetical protein
MDYQSTNGSSFEGPNAGRLCVGIAELVASTNKRLEKAVEGAMFLNPFPGGNAQ